MSDKHRLSSEPGELGIGFNENRHMYELTLVDLNNRPIACMLINAELFERAVTAKLDADGEHPYVGVMFHLHTLKELIAP